RKGSFFVTVKKKIIICFAAVLAIAAMIFAYWYNNEFANISYVQFEGKCYRVMGASWLEEHVHEYVGEIKRITPRTFWNKDGDSNCSFVGARIAVVSDGDYAVEQRIYHADTGEYESWFMWMNPGE
ncbi:MAG: hypothetical protein IJE83_04475, partial [Oscillospiraceae bacterium]|nr:hypothetical protein [Oscillospiraceae bacterium]